MNWLKKRLKSKTIWLTSIAPGALAFIAFALLAWGSREVTTKSLDDK